MRFLEWAQQNKGSTISLPTGKTPEHFIKHVTHYLNTWETKETRKDLEELLRFRHVVRNIYGFELDADRIDNLIDLTAGIFPRFTKEIEKFVAFLKAIYNES